MRRLQVRAAVSTLSALAAVALVATLWLGAGSPSKSEQVIQPAAQGVHHKLHLENRKLVIQALQGSPEAASKLISIYDDCLGRADSDDKLSDFCWREVRRWTEVGLQNGSSLAAQMKVNELLQSTKCDDLYRAEYWLMRYRRTGAGNEMMWKADASSIEKKRRSCSW